ncbi:MAG: hemolysin family protein [Candidatus Binatia bacterium]
MTLDPAYGILAILVLLAFGATLALAEASMSRMTPVRAMALREQGLRNAALLERIQADPTRYLNAIYLCVMFAQNGSAILVAILAERYFDEVGLTITSIVFTLAYFVIVEAMSKTFAVLHSDRVALLLAPFVYVLGKIFWLPTRALIGLANVLLPGKGLKGGPFVTEHEIRSLAEVGHQEGVIEEHAKEIIHSVFQFGDRVVRDIMVPRPDIVAIEVTSSLSEAAAVVVERGVTRLPVYHDDLDHVEGQVHAKDILRALHEGNCATGLTELLRPVRFMPESKRLIDLLREMQAERFHMALVSDEYGSVAGLVTLEDLLEELVGQITDEYDREAPEVIPLGDGRYRVNAALSIVELNEMLEADLPRHQWNTVGGLVFGVAGRIPAEGESVRMDGFTFTVERVQGRRILSVVVSSERMAAAEAESTSNAAS